MENIKLDEPAKPKKLSKDDLRAAIFAAENSRVKRVPIKFQGQELELKQPTVEEIMQFHSLPEGRSNFAYILINHVYIPGTDEKLFDEADYDAIVAMPYSPEIVEIQNVMTGFLSSDVKSAEKN